MKLALALVLAPACAWGPGGPMGEVTVALDAAWVVPADRDAGGGWQKLASDFQVQIERARWTASELVLVDVGDAALAFDPARPPPGYSNCHGGHCHADDGRLVPYEDISAELTGGAPAGVLAFALDTLDLLAGDERVLACGGAPCDVPRASVGRVEIELTRLEVTGRVRDTLVPPRLAEQAFAAILDVDAHVIGRIDLPIDRGSPPQIELAVGLHPTAALFDDVPFDQMTFDTVPTAVGELELELSARRTE